MPQKPKPKDTISFGNYYDLHTGLHGIFLNNPNRTFVFRAAKPKILCNILKGSKRGFHPAQNPFYCELHQYPADSRFIQSVFFPVANRVPWIADMDDICLPLFGNACINRSLMKKLYQNYSSNPLYRKTMLARIGSYSTPFCRGILFTSLFGIKLARASFKQFDLYDAPEVQNFLSKVALAYPVTKPLIRKVRLHNPRIILFMGRDFEDKGGNIALATFEKLNKYNPHLRLIYCGPIPEKYKKRYAALLEKIAYFPGVTHPQALCLLKMSDIYLSPTQFEGLAITLIEAKAAGCVPATYYGHNLETMPEVITDHQTGILLKKPSSPADEKKEANRFFKAIISLLPNTNLLKRMKERGLREVTDGKFSFSKRIELLKALFGSEPEPTTGTTNLNKLKLHVYSAEKYNNIMLKYREAHKIHRRMLI